MVLRCFYHRHRRHAPMHKHHIFVFVTHAYIYIYIRCRWRAPPAATCWRCTRATSASPPSAPSVGSTRGGLKSPEPPRSTAPHSTAPTKPINQPINQSITIPHTGANGLANPRDFKYPVAAFEDREDAPFRLVRTYVVCVCGWFMRRADRADPVGVPHTICKRALIS